MKSKFVKLVFLATKSYIYINVHNIVAVYVDKHNRGNGPEIVTCVETINTADIEAVPYRVEGTLDEVMEAINSAMGE